MKCFSVLILFSSLAFAELVIKPLGKSKITTGDIVEVEVEIKPGESIPSLEGERLGNVLYVLEQDERKLKVIVAPAKNNNMEVKSIDVRLQGFDFEYKQVNPPKDFLMEEKDYKLLTPVEPWKKIIVTFFLVVAGWFGVRFLVQKNRVRNEKRKFAIKANEALEIVKKADSRQEIEAFFRKRKEYETMLEWNEKSFSTFVYTLNSHQFKPAWSEAEENEVKKAFMNLKKSMGVKSGI